VTNLIKDGWRLADQFAQGGFYEGESRCFASRLFWSDLFWDESSRAGSETGDQHFDLVGL
jgi:hypothetical protein